MVRTAFNTRTAFSALMALALVFTMMVGSFAASSMPTIAITEEMLMPLVDGVVANISVILPIGLALFGIMLGIRLIPGLVSRFTHM